MSLTDSTASSESISVASTASTTASTSISTQLPKEKDDHDHDQEPDLPPTLTTKKSKRELLDREKLHKKITRKHPEFELTYDMMLGIRTTVGKAESQPHRKLKTSDYNTEVKMRFPSEGSALTPAHEMRSFKFKDYAPEVFRNIRARFNIEAADYLLTICGDFQYLEFISNSKSGQFFFYSHDRRYMIKTISQNESKFLRKILPDYAKHILSNPNTLLNRFMGMHRVKPHKKKEVHFLIMGSVFYGTKFIHRTFDLKGSKQGRFATAGEKESLNCVFKDNDFLDQKIRIEVGPKKADLLKKQLAADVEFLRKLKIMDYSVLLGIHDGGAPVPSPPEPTPKSDSDLLFPTDKVDGMKIEVLKSPSSPDLKQVPVRRATSASSSPHSTDEKRVHRHTIGGSSEIPLPLEPGFRRQSTYGVPKRYNVHSSPIDIQFHAPAFEPIPVKELGEVKKRSDSAKSLAVNSVFSQDEGGCRGADKENKPTENYYYMGVIDILTTWGAKKKVESSFKSLKYDKTEISAVDPSLYAKRFLDFMNAAIQ
jgi:1-phosphatidylinositol-4-phosphate 5-kinase